METAKENVIAKLKLDVKESTISYVILVIF